MHDKKLGLNPERVRRTAAAVLLALSLGAGSAWSAELNAVLDKDRTGTKASVEATAAIEALQAKGDDLQAQKQASEREAVLLEHYRGKLLERITQTESAVQAVEEERAQLRGLRLQLYPLMERMTAAYERFVQADMPFLRGEREARAAHLRAGLNDPALTDEQKMDLLLDAYQVEVSYGYTFGVESGENERGELSRFLRTGRLGYFAVNAAKNEASFWQDGWQTLKSGSVPMIMDGIASAAGESAPSIMWVPREAVQAPVPAAKGGMND